MAEVVAAVQERLLARAGELEKLARASEEDEALLAEAAAGGAGPLAGELAGTLGCIRVDQLGPALQALREAARPPEPRATGSPGEDRAAPDRPATRGELRIAARAREAVTAHRQAERLDRQGAPQLEAELLALPPAARRAALARDHRFASPALGDRLLDRADAGAPGDPREAAHLADLVLSIQRRLLPPWKRSEAAALKGRALLRKGEAHRLRGDLQAAEGEHSLAAREFEPLPTGGPERAELCRFLARLRHDQGQDDEALALLGRAIERFTVHAGQRRAMECRLELAWLLLEEMEIEEAASLFELAVAEWKDPAETPALWASARRGLALACAELRRPARARALVAELAEVAARGSRVDRLRQVRFAAGVEHRLGADDEAESLLKGLWPELAEEGEAVEAALAGLDLAQHYVEAEKRLEIELLGAGLLGIGGLGDLMREVISFVLRFAALRGPGASWVVESGKRYLEKARHNPELPFSVVRRPHGEMVWGSSQAEAVQGIVGAAGLGEAVALCPGVALSPADRRQLVWSVEAAHGVRLVFHEAGAGARRDTEGEPGDSTDDTGNVSVGGTP